MMPSVGRIVTVIGLTAAWCGLWRDISVANAVVGFGLAIAIVATGYGTPGTSGVRIRPLLRLVWLVFLDLVSSTVAVAREILTPTDYTEEAIIAVVVEPGSDQHFLLLTVAITLTPGTAVIDADPASGTLYLHLLHFDKASETETHVKRLAELSCRALPQTHVGRLP